MGTLQVGGTTLGVKNTSTNKIDLSNVGDINVEGDIKNSGLEYLSARWPLANDTTSVNDTSLETTDTSKILYNANVLSWTHSADNVDPESADFTITGLTTGIWYMHATFGFDRSGDSDSETTTLMLEENGTLIWEGKQNYSSNQNVSQSFSLIRDYTSSVPSPVKIMFECSKTGHFRKLGNCITIYRLG